MRFSTYYLPDEATPVDSLIERMKSGEHFVSTMRHAKLNGPGSWKATYLTVTLTVEWKIYARPAVEGVAHLSDIVTEADAGHTLGTLIDALLRDGRTRTTYNENCRQRSHKGNLGELIERLERETGKSAFVCQMKMQGRGIIIPTAQDKALIR
ncbi:hypothetical protein LTR27_000735 [Elasticomyces elasticus]|nr:hypothetical protein LTR27_000735 [Elasticomyces elasticus]